MRPKRLPTNLSTTPENTLWKAITASALLCRPSAGVRRGESEAARRRSIAVWRSCLRRATGFSIGSCKQSLQDVWPSPVGPGRHLTVFERAKINLDERQWYAPELLRIRGELALGNDEGLAVCREYFLRALELSDRASELVVGAQGRDQPCDCRKVAGRKEAAWRTLQATHAKFREGLETSDLRLAKQVLNGSYRPDSNINSLH